MNKTKQNILTLLVLVLGMTTLLIQQVSAGYGFYVTDASVRKGMIVSVGANPGVIEPTNNDNVSSVIGVVGSAMSDLDVQPGQVAVQTDGVVQTLVSTLDGDITVGDKIGASSVVGIGSKNIKSGWIVGVAQGSLNSATQGAVKTTLTDSTGKSREVYVGNIPVLIQVVYYNPSQNSSSQVGSDEVLPPVVHKFADSIAGKRASIVAVVLATLVQLMGFIASGIIINSTIRNGIVSVARQPLAKKLIVSSMIRTLSLALILLMASTICALLVIRLL